MSEQVTGGRGSPSQSGSPKFCIICNTKLRSKRQSKCLSSEIVTAMNTLWATSLIEENEDLFLNEIRTCPDCYKNLRQVSTLLQQLGTLRQLLFKLKLDMEKSIKSSLCDPIEESINEKSESNILVESNSRREQINERIVKLRLQIVESSKISKLRQSVGTKTATSDSFDDGCDGSSSEIFNACSLYEPVSVAESNMNFDGRSYEERQTEKGGKSTNFVTPDEQFDIFYGDGEDGTGFVPGETEDIRSLDRLKCLQAECRFTFKDEVGRKAHVKKYHQGNKYSYECEVCDKMFQTRRQLKIHDMGHRGEAPFICEQCGKGFRTEQFLQGHLKSIHQWGISDRFACNLCGKKFVTEAKLRAHEIIHTKQYPVHCSFCSKGFVTKSALKTHMVKHMAVNPWQCSEPECGKSFSTRKALESHKSFHTGRFKTTCSLCSWGGPSEAALKKHMLKHSADSNFECDKCSKKFKYPNTLKKHMKIHANQKDFSCTICNKAFIDNYKLLRHMKIHEGSRPFGCSVCQKQFRTKDSLKTHTRIHIKPTASSVPEDTVICNPDLTENYNNDSSEILLPQTFDPCELMPCINESHVNVTETGAIKPTSIFTEIGSQDIFPGEMFQFSYDGL